MVGDPVICVVCDAVYDGTRDEARARGRWEPYGRETQADLDEGPVVCPECVVRAINRLVREMLRVARTHPFGGE